MNCIDDGNGNLIGDKDMSGGDNINNLKISFNREKVYIKSLEIIRNELRDILKQPIGFISPKINGLINYIGDILEE